MIASRQSYAGPSGLITDATAGPRRRPVHVGLNLVFLTPGQQGGLEVYAREVVERLVHRGDLRLTAFVNRDCRGQAWTDGIPEVLVPIRPSDRKQWVLGEQLELPPLAGRAGCDLVHSFASTAPLWGSFRRITTIHDLQYKVVPDAHVGFLRYGMHVLVGGAARRSHRIITDSHSTARDLATYLHVPPAKTDVIPLGVRLRAAAPASLTRLRNQLDLDDRPLLLSASAKRPAKNLERLIRAHALLPAPRPVLVLPGYPTPHEAVLQHLARTMGTFPDIRFLGWVSAEDLEGLYRLASAFVFPSLYEGFGLPPLEAMAHGVPVITSDRGALGEVVGGAALIIDPESIGEIAAAIQEVLVDTKRRHHLIKAGFERATEFSWERTVDLTVDSYHRAMASR
jgi:glycosyltransferase involved in cell wall biosynthesis